MALKKTGTKAPASRGLDYSLGKDTLDRVKKATDSRSKVASGGDMLAAGLGGVAKTLTGVVEEKQKQEEAKIEAENKWDEGFESLGNRGSWATPELFDKFATLETEYRDDYNAAVASGNKQEAAKLLKQQQNRSAQLQQWKTAVEGSQDTWKNDLWAKNMPTEDKQIINAINSQENVQIAYTDPNEEKGTPGGDMVFRITLENGQTKDVTLNEYNKIATRNIAPVAIEKAFKENMKLLNESAASDQTFNFEPGSQRYNSQLTDNAKLITRDNFQVMFNNSFTGGENTFADDILEHKDFNNVKLEGLKVQDNEVAKQFDTDGDGKVSKEEAGAADFVSLSKKDKQKIVELMQKEENFDVAKAYLADYMTRIQYNNAIATRSDYETERTDALKYAKHNKGK